MPQINADFVGLANGLGLIARLHFPRMDQNLSACALDLFVFLLAKVNTQLSIYNYIPFSGSSVMIKLKCQENNISIRCAELVDNISLMHKRLTTTPKGRMMVYTEE